MAPRGLRRWALLLAWLPAGEWGRAGVAEGSRPSPGTPLPGPGHPRGTGGPGAALGFRPGCRWCGGGSGGRPAGRGREGEGVAWPRRALSAPRRRPPPGGGAERPRARHEGRAERSFGGPEGAATALLGGSGRLPPGSLRDRSAAASLVSTRARGANAEGLPFGFWRAPAPASAASSAAPASFGVWCSCRAAMPAGDMLVWRAGAHRHVCRRPSASRVLSAKFHRFPDSF